MKKILIITYHFHPENTPRAFRAYELAQEYSNRGYKVDVIIPNNDYNYDYDLLETNIRIIKTKNYSYMYDSDSGVNKISIIRKIDKLRTPLKKMYRYIIPEDMFRYSKSIADSEKIIDTKYNKLISIGMPFAVHLGSMFLIKRNKKIADYKIADYGDPFYYNVFSKKAIYFKWIEKYTTKFFDYITIPVESSVKYYSHIDNNKIKIIPQGFNFRKIKLNKYQKNNICTFAFAGIFYKKLRDPSNFLEVLSKCEKQFKFIMYTNIRSKEFQQLVSKYICVLGDKLEVRDIIPRNECIKELSKMDFLINIENLNSLQTPSKVIDYTLTKRPIYSFDEVSFSKGILNKFMLGDYSQQLKVNIDKYNIENVVDRFEEISKK